MDKCTECGFCEVKCPSRDLTTTPRQRIVIRREMARLQKGNGANRELYAALDAEFPYMVLGTCATDGLCATACPVSIDTGQLTKRFRRARHSSRAQKFAYFLGRNFAMVERGVRTALRVGHGVQAVFGPGAMIGITRLMRAVAGPAIPLWTPDFPHPASGRRPVTQRATAQAVYFLSCISRTMGRLSGEPKDLSLTQAFVKLASRAGVPVYIPENVVGNCCGVPLSSKGYDQAHKFTVNRTIERFWQWSDKGRLPIVIDTSPCTYGVVRHNRISCRKHLDRQRHLSIWLVIRRHGAERERTHVRPSP